MIMRLMTVVLVAALVSCAGGGGAGNGGGRTPASPVVPPSPFAVHQVRFTNSAVDEGAALRELGARTARIAPPGSLIWDQIETERDVYHWDLSDRVLGAGASSGASLFVGVGAQNRLDAPVPAPGSLPNDMDRYLRFLRAAAERYDGDGVDDAPGSPTIDVLQIGNEADGPAFWKDTPENYALLLKRSFQTIKQAAPGIRVAIAGAATPRGYYEFYRPVLAELDRIRDKAGDRYFDIFDIHWSGQFPGDDDYDIISLPSGSYDLRTVASDIRGDLAAIGYDGIPLYITEMSDYSDAPDGFTLHSEAQHAAAVVKRYVYALAAGIEKIFWSQAYEEHDAGGIANGYFDNVGLINNPQNSDGYSHRKLAYYSYRKMAELLDGSDSRRVQVLQDADRVRIYGFTKAGRTVYAAWWDHLRDPGYTPGMTKAVTLRDVTGAAVTVTEAVPCFESGREVTDYATAFRTRTFELVNGAVTFELGEVPVFAEVVE